MRKRTNKNKNNKKRELIKQTASCEYFKNVAKKKKE